MGEQRSRLSVRVQQQACSAKQGAPRTDAGKTLVGVLLDSPGSSGRRDTLTSIVVHERWQRGVVNAVGIGGVWIFAAWKVPMGLPGHRALGWLTMLLLVRLLAGPGRAAFVGVFSAALVLVTGISPNGLWGVAQYAIAGVLLDAALTLRPSIGSRAVYMALLGATVLLAVGWIAPLGRSMTGGIPMTEIWPSVVSVAGAGLSRLFVLDIVFGATAGLMSLGLARALTRAWRPAGNAPELLTTA